MTSRFDKFQRVTSGVLDLGVLLDSELKQHISKVASCCCYHIRRLRQVSRFISHDIMMQLTSAFILSRLDYSNIILAGLPKSSIATLQCVQNAAAHLVLRLGPRDQPDGLRQLHWLPIETCIRYKLCLRIFFIWSIILSLIIYMVKYRCEMFMTYLICPLPLSL